MVGWGGVVCKVIFISNPTFVELLLSWGFDNFNNWCPLVTFCVESRVASQLKKKHVVGPAITLNKTIIFPAAMQFPLNVRGQLGLN